MGDHGFSRSKQPWESTDGAIYLFRELSIIDKEFILNSMENLIDITRIDHFSHSVYLHENIWKSIPIIAKNIGKNPFKQTLEIIIPQLFNHAKSHHRNLSIIAIDCILAINKFIGPNIFKSRVENLGLEYLELFKNIIDDHSNLISNY